MKSLYVFGNEYLDEDSLAHEVAARIKQRYGDAVRIVACRSPDELLEAEGEELLILDVVKNLREPVVIDDIAHLHTRPIMTIHDFDVAYLLRLMRELGIEKNIKIIGIPPTGDAKKIAQKVVAWM